MGRYPVGECCLAEKTTPILSSYTPPGCLLLLPNRHAGRPRALWPFPPCGHQEELHSVTQASSHFSMSREGKSREVLISKHCPWVENSQVSCWRRLPACHCIADENYFWRSVNKAVGLGEEVLWINWLNTNNYRPLVAGLYNLRLFCCYFWVLEIRVVAVKLLHLPGIWITT